MQTQQNYFERLQRIYADSPKFTVLVKTIRASQMVKVEMGCYGIYVVNFGDVLVTCEQFPLLPRLGPGMIGGFFGWSDNERLFGKDKISVLFTAGGTDPQVVISQIVLI